MSSGDEECGESNGFIRISFDNHPTLDMIQFSLDGGDTWQPAVADDSGSAMYAGLSAGTYDLQVRNFEGGCVQALSIVDLENILPFNISLDIPQSGICLNVSPVTLRGGLPVGGTYSGAGIIGGAAFDPALAGAGTHSISYTYTNADGCSATVVDEIEVYFVEDVVLDLSLIHI